MEIKYKYNVLGEVDSYNYYRSDAPMDVNNMPHPTTTNILTTEYTDTTAEIDRIYYVRFSSIKDDLEKISEELTVDTSTRADYLLNMPFSQDINDHGKFSLTATSFGGAVIEGDHLYIPSNGYITLTPTQSEFDIGIGDFEFGVEVLMMSTGHGTFPSLFNIGTAWASGAVSMQFNASTRRFMCAVMNPTERDTFAPTAQAFDGTTWVKYVVKRVGGVITTYQDGVAGTPITDNLSINFARNNRITIGAAAWALGTTRSHSRIKNLYLKSLGEQNEF